MTSHSQTFSLRWPSFSRRRSSPPFHPLLAEWIVFAPPPESTPHLPVPPRLRAHHPLFQAPQGLNALVCHSFSWSLTTCSTRCQLQCRLLLQHSHLSQRFGPRAHHLR
uniref:Uncharacterized protein n=1 Tax=Sparus aurata TaxID=8175 RepID=A0A671UTR5_SPAAU